MKRVASGKLVRVDNEPALEDEKGKVKLIYNLFDGLSGKKIRVTIETLE